MVAKCFDIWVPNFEANTVEVDVNEVVNSDVKAAAKSGSNSRGPRPNQESVELARWALNFLRNEATPIPKGKLFDEAGALDKIGDYGPDNRGKLSWKEGYKLSRAIDRVRYLGGDDAGWTIDETTVDGRKYLRAVREHVATESEKPASPSNGGSQDALF